MHSPDARIGLGLKVKARVEPELIAPDPNSDKAA